MIPNLEYKYSDRNNLKCWLYLAYFRCQVLGKMSIQQPAVETEALVQTNLGIPHAYPPSFPGKGPLTHPILSVHKEPGSVSRQRAHF